MDRLTVEPIPGTENADDISFSPDGQWILYSIAGQKLAKVSISGGAPVVLCPIQTPTRGTSWSSDNTVLFGLVNDGIFGVSSSGGTPYPVTVLDTAAGEISHRFPQLLPDGKTVIFTVKNNSITTFDDAVIVAQRTDNAERKVLIRGGSYPKFISTGYLTYMRGNSILAVPFDAERLEIRGTAVQVQEGGWFLQGAGNAHMDFSADGMLVFAPTGAQSGSVSSLAWMARDGIVRPLYDSLKPYTAAIVSPDGEKIALGINAANNDVWVYQIPRAY
jgi:serine/threonine-protein kinase